MDSYTTLYTSVSVVVYSVVVRWSAVLFWQK